MVGTERKLPSPALVANREETARCGGSVAAIEAAPQTERRNAMTRPSALIAAAALLALCPAVAAAAQPRLKVDARGVLRDTASGRPAYFFGVNYTAPFAYSYRALRARGVDPKRAIDLDVEQMARLKLNAYRIHVWDREISDSAGNLLQNEHLELLDYLLARLAEKKIAVILTPIAWWATGWPEPDPDTPGFATRFTKQQMNTDPAAIAASVNYIRQLLAHVNRETGRRYVDDPNLVAVELFNEPRHAEDAPTTAYVNRLVEPVRALGYRGPIFYNISEQGNRPGFAAALCRANIQGVSYQWYPTGLTHGSTIRANMLPNVRRYDLPFEDVAACRGKAKMVYEFDAADVTASTMYPAMADAFRSAGFQWATQFAYDPSHIADTNTEYPTHYLNLLYTPSKAIGFLIAGERFRGAPGLNTSHAADRSELVTSTAFFHTAGTASRPPNAGRLREIAGVGSSPLVDYGGTGAYFLDKVRDGVWRLEVYPDVIEHSDPFAKVSLDRQVRQLVAGRHRMRLRLPDLGDSFEVAGTRRHRAEGGAFEVAPGRYILSRRGGETAPQAPLPVPPEALRPGAGVAHRACRVAPSGTPLRVAANVTSSEPLRAVVLHARRVGDRAFTQFPMSLAPTGAYEATVPAESELMRPGRLEYAVSVETPAGSTTFPGSQAGTPAEWNFLGDTFWTTHLVPRLDHVPLFTPAAGMSDLLTPRYTAGREYRFDLVPGPRTSETALQIRVAPAGAATPLPFMLRMQSAALRDPCGVSAEPLIRLRFAARSATGAGRRATVAVVTANGAAWGTDIEIGAGWQEFSIPLTALKRVPLALLPSAYPTFQPEFEKDSPAAPPLSAAAVEGVQLVVQPDAAATAGWAVELGEIALSD